MSQSLRERILNFVTRGDYRPMKPRRLAHAMQAEGASYAEFRGALRALVTQGELIVTGGGNIAPLRETEGMVGVYRANRRGFGFVIPTAPTAIGDLFIPPGAQADAQDGDTVQCRVRQSGQRFGKPTWSGQVVRIIRRGATIAVGRLHHIANRWLVKPEGGGMRDPIQVGDVTAKDARIGDHVVVEILQYPTELTPGKGVIVERLGPGGKVGVDVRSIIRRHALPDQFSAAALEDARTAAGSMDVDEELTRREDLRGELLVTIDPPDARDFDDAISIRRLDGQTTPMDSPTANAADPSTPSSERTVLRRGRKLAGAASNRTGVGRTPRKSGKKNAQSPFEQIDALVSRRTHAVAGATSIPATDDGANWELGVHIADVCAFVSEGSSLDADARERGTSVYFPRHVVPMLPEIISNAVCSLQEGQPRLCKSVFIRFDAVGRPLSARFANTVIQSSCRLTYVQAQSAIDGADSGVPHAVRVLLVQADALARIIRARRLKQGMLVLELPEIDLVLDEDDRVTDARPTDTSFTHTIIEMFMVEANEAAARELTQRGIPFLRRVHAEPDARALESLMRYLRTVGVSPARRPSRGELQRILADVRGRPEARMINLAVLKSMAQAAYAPGNEGHYALASECYCHFTSPIRRYPDLHVHRLLETHVMPSGNGTAPKKRKPPTAAKSRRRAKGLPTGGHDASEWPSAPRGRQTIHDEPASGDIAALGRHCSTTERRAQEAERELRLVKIMEFLGRHIGDSYDGIITGVNTSGLFVQHPRFLVDGVLEVSELPDDRWQMDESRSQLVGRRTGRRYRLGDSLRVTIAHMDMPSRRILLTPAQTIQRKRRK